MNKPKPRDRNDYAKNTSKRHRAVGDILNAGIFEKMTVYQEYPVVLLNEACTNGRLKLDWYIQDLNVAIEVQGEHHSKPVTYGGRTQDDAQLSFRNQLYRDAKKANFLQEVGCTLIEISPDDPLDASNIIRRITNASQQQDSTPQKEVSTKKASKWQKLSTEQKERRREHNRKRYRELRERQKSKCSDS